MRLALCEDSVCIRLQHRADCVQAFLRCALASICQGNVMQGGHERVSALYRFLIHSATSGKPQDVKIAAVLEREHPRLWGFIRQRVRDQFDAEDILQDVFYELVVAYRLAKPIEQAGAWMFRVARNRIIDLIRRQKAVSLDQDVGAKDGDTQGLANLLKSPDAGPEAAYARRLLILELERALAELPPNQRAVFVAHEFEGRTFHELARETGVSVNTLLWRKHRAVLRLRRRLQNVYNELGSLQGGGSDD